MQQEKSSENWDVIVVGARCAGATLAALVAKQGLRTLVLEASPRGTDMPMSTHYVQPPGMDVLDEIGVGDKVRAVTPKTTRFRLALDETELLANLPLGRPGYCVRRSTLDPWLQEAAENAGATLRDRHRVVDLVRDGNRATGVVARGPSGDVTLHADLVVGADGPHSTVAKLTGVEEYLVTHGSRAGYWAYYPAPTNWTEDWDATLEHKGDDVRYVFRCNQDQIALVYMGDRDEVLGWGKDYRERLAQALAGSDTTGPITEGKEPVGKTLGLLKTRFFYRRPVGPGFALVGDAGHFKDFVTGQGMADAFLDARRLSRAIVDGRDEAFEHYWRERDVATLPLHFDAIRQGEVGYNTPFMRWVIGCLAKRADLRDRLPLVMDRKIDPGELLSMRTMVGFMGAALVRGRFDVLGGFLEAGPSMSAEAKELEQRRKLLEAARLRLERAPARKPADPAIDTAA